MPFFIERTHGKNTTRFCGHRCSMLQKWAEPGYKERLSKAVSSGLKGHVVSDEEKRKLSLAFKGKHTSPATQFKTGFIPWNTGSKEFGEFMKRQWTPERKTKASERMKALWQTPEHREKVIPKLPNEVPYSGTSIELRLRNALSEAGLKFEVNAFVGRVCRPDIVFTGQKVAVFADGCYFHECERCGFRDSHVKDPRIYPDIRARDERKANMLVSMGWLVLRFWGHELKDIGTAKMAAAEIGQALQERVKMFPP